MLRELNVRKRKVTEEDRLLSLRSRPEWWWGCDKESWDAGNTSYEEAGMYCHNPAEELTFSDIIW